MLKKILTTMLAVSALGVTAPVAQATAPIAFDCRAAVFADAYLTGDDHTFTGFAVGFVVSREPVENVSIRCYIAVDGGQISSTPPGSGLGAAATAGQVTYTAFDGQDVRVCADWTAGADSGTSCFAVNVIPTAIGRDLLEATAAFVDEVLWILGVTPIICPILQALTPGIPNIVDIDAEGDVTVLATKVIDCPPRGT